MGGAGGVLPGLPMLVFGISGRGRWNQAACCVGVPQVSAATGHIRGNVARGVAGRMVWGVEGLMEFVAQIVIITLIAGVVLGVIEGRTR